MLMLTIGLPMEGEERKLTLSDTCAIAATAKAGMAMIAEERISMF